MVTSDAYCAGRKIPRDNPSNGTVHDVAKVGNIERACFYDIDKCGTDEVFPVTSPVYIFKLKKDAQGKGTGSFEQFIVDPKGGAGGHGFGCGDINGDGHADLLFTGGWLESPANPYDLDKWTWHKEWDLGSASVPILVHDVNERRLERRHRRHGARLRFELVRTEERRR